METNFKLTIGFLMMLFLMCNNIFAQSELLYSKTFVDKMYLNPSYNTIINVPIINIHQHEQWKNKVEGAPETIAVNGFVPVNRYGMGIGAGIISEKIGLRKNHLISVSLSHRLKTSKKSYIALGYSLGLQITDYNKSEILSLAPSIDTQSIDFTNSMKYVSVGGYYYNPRMYVGLSTNLLLGDNIEHSGLFPGFDLTGGVNFQLYDKIRMTPELSLKYYKIEEYIKSGNETKVSSNDIFLQLFALKFIYDDKLALSIGHRFDYSQSFAFDILLQRRVKVGYLYEIGVGKHFNSHDSQGIRLSVVLNKLSEKTTKRKLSVPII